jgi:hypothetical protein
VSIVVLVIVPIVVPIFIFVIVPVVTFVIACNNKPAVRFVALLGLGENSLQGAAGTEAR